MNHFFRPAGAALAVCVSVLAGCASMAVSDDLIVTRTTSALGLPASEFTISKRADSGVRTDYIATTKANRVFQCYVAGSFSVTGRVVSDAICSPMSGGPAASAAPAAASPGATPAPAGNCNALLRAAGRC